MREDAFARQQERLHDEKKPLSKGMLFLLYAGAAMLLLFAFITKNRYIIFVFFTAFEVITNYHTNMQTIRLDEGSEIFLSLLLTRAYGVGFGIAHIIFTAIIVDFITGRMDKNDIISSIFAILANLIMSIFKTFNFVIAGLVLVTIKFIAELGVDFAIGEDPDEILLETVAGFIGNVVLFVAFGDFFIKLLV